MRISDFVHKNLVTVNLKSRTRESVLSEIVGTLCVQKKIKDSKAVLQMLTEREKRSSTGIGKSVAIPHARLEDLKEVVFFVGVARQGIDFYSADGQPVHLIVLFLTPLAESGTHLKILSKLAAMFVDSVFLNELINAPTDEELCAILKQSPLEKKGFSALTKEEIYLELGTTDLGISESDAQQRQEEYGCNRLKTIKKTPLFIRFISNFTNLFAILMWVGSALSFLAQMPEVGWAIIIVIVINALFSFWQEFKAEKAIDALKQLMPSYTRVMRGGEEKKVLTQSIVPGDIIIVEEGDHIPADARLIDAQELRVNNSAFSGESKLSHKMAEGFQNGKHFLWLEMPNLIFAGTSVSTGMGKAVVIATGMGTEIGKIAYLTQTVREELSPLQKEINRLTKLIAVLAIVTGFLFFFIGFASSKMSFVGSLMFAIGIIIANVPEGLMPAVTLALAMAVQRMAKRNALIKKLSSVETLGCTNVICTDKTGTLTTNQMSVHKVWLNDRVIEISGSGYEPAGSFSCDGKPISAATLRDDDLQLLFRTGALCNTAKLVPPSATQTYWTIIGDPTEAALLTLMTKAGFDYEQERKDCPVERRFPFESVRKRMSSIHKLPDNHCYVFVKGAPKEIMDFSTNIILGKKISFLTDEKRAEITAQIDHFAQEGLRVLAFAYRECTSGEGFASATAPDVEKDLIFIGVTAMYDPPRPEVKNAVAICKKAGIRVVMITGDYQLTAVSIARQVGIISSGDPAVITGTELTDLTDTQLKDVMCQKEVVFARVNPEHKLRVVSAFKELGNIVAVTGDGVNDAPALKRADIGVAMGLRGTDVAKESAEMVLIDDNFASIVSAIEEGRAVFENIKKFITYIFAHLVPEAVPFILYVLLKIPVPITAMQILAIDLGTETLPALALGIEKPEPGIMDHPPRQKKKGIINNVVLFRGYIFLGLLNTAAVLAAYYGVLYSGGWKPGMQLETTDTAFANPLHLKATTIVFVGIVVMQIANVFACRSERHSAFKIGFLNNKLILWGILFELLFTATLVYVPFFQKIFNTIGLGWKDWGILFIFMAVIFILEELRKIFAEKYFKK